MNITPPPIPEKPVPVPNNPTDGQRHSILMDSLTKVGRLEDYENIITLLSPPPDITTYASPGEFKNIKVGIIGAGLAGLSAAFELRKLGFNITIFEANEERIGGRVYTHYFDKEKKLHGEFGAMRIPVAHEILWHYINLFKLNTAPFIQTNPNTFVNVHNISVRNDPKGKNIVEKIYPLFNLTSIEKEVPWPQLYSSISSFLLSSVSPPVRTELLKILPQYNPVFLKIIDNGNSELSIFNMMGLSYGAIELITSLVPIASAFLYSSYEESLNEEYSRDFINPYWIPDGMSKLPLAFYTSLISQYPKECNNIPQNLLGKVVFKQGQWVSGIYKSDTNGKVILNIRSKTEPKGINESFDYVICAIPLSTLRQIETIPRFSDRQQRAIIESTYMDAQKTLFLCSERFWEKGSASERIIGGASYTDMIIQSIVYPSDHGHCIQEIANKSPSNSTPSCSPNEPGVLTASYNFNLDAIRLGNAEPLERFELIKRQVELVHGLPKFYLDNIVVDTKTVDWDREVWTKGAFSVSLPEQTLSFAYELLRPAYNNTLYFAGDHTSAKHGWMQGSLESGMRAANTLATNAKGSVRR